MQGDAIIPGSLNATSTCHWYPTSSRDDNGLRKIVVALLSPLRMPRQNQKDERAPPLPFGTGATCLSRRGREVGRDNHVIQLEQGVSGPGRLRVEGVKRRRGHGIATGSADNDCSFPRGGFHVDVVCTHACPADDLQAACPGYAARRNPGRASNHYAVVFRYAREELSLAEGPGYVHLCFPSEQLDSLSCYSVTDGDPHRDHLSSTKAVSCAKTDSAAAISIAPVPVRRRYQGVPRWAGKARPNVVHHDSMRGRYSGTLHAGTLGNRARFLSSTSWGSW